MADHFRTPEELAKYHLQDPKSMNMVHTIASMAHRQRLVKLWSIPRGASVLEIGCGQGDFTIVLADAVGPTGRVVAIDPAPGTYGTPPISEAQAYVLASPVGSQIRFITTEAPAYLESTPESFDFIVLCHCIWYFGKPEILPLLLNSVAVKHTNGASLLIAEFALTASQAKGLPHLLSVLAQNTLESFETGRSWRNVCCALTPSQITTAAAGSGWVLSEEEILAPIDGQRDGYRETLMILHKQDVFTRDVKALDTTDKIKSMLLCMRDAVAASVKNLPEGILGVGNMDIWAAKFKLNKD